MIQLKKESLNDMRVHFSFYTEKKKSFLLWNCQDISQMGVGKRHIELNMAFW